MNRKRFDYLYRLGARPVRTARLRKKRADAQDRLFVMMGFDYLNMTQPLWGGR